MSAKERSGIITGIVAYILFGGSFMVIKIIFNHGMTFAGVLFWRMALASVMLWLLLKIKPPQNKMTFRQWLRIWPLAICEPILYYTGESIGVNHTGAAISGTIIAMIPIFTIIFARIFLRERHTAWQIWAIILSVTGVSLIAFAKGGDVDLSGAPIGFICLILAVASASAYQIMLKGWDDRYSPEQFTLGISLYGLLFFGAYSLIEAGVTHDFHRLFLLPIDQPEVLLMIVALTATNSVAGFILLNRCISFIGPTRCSSFAGITTIISILCGIFLLKEGLTFWQLVGAVMIIIGAWAANYFTPERVWAGEKANNALESAP
ncbi:MAG: DMT family transporter [Firmicutes bacterium]|nr:DMT family transporter [Bacillota bacterium]